MKIHKTPVMITVKNSIDDTYRLEEGNIEVWYDQSLRIWVAAIFDRNGNQQGDCEYANSKELAIKYIKIVNTDDIRVI